MPPDLDPVHIRASHVGQADWLGGRAVVGAGDPGDRDAKIGVQAGPDADRHLTGDLRADGAVRPQDVFVDVEEGDLRLIGIRDDPAAEIAG